MSSYQIVDAKAEHIPAIARRVRQADLDELWAAGAVLPERALKMSLETADYAKTGIIEGEPVCMWGVGKNGSIWMIGTDLIEKHRRIFLRESKREFEQAKGRYDLLYNWVDIRNRKAVRWLKWLNFTMGEAEPYGLFRKSFYPFYWQAQEKRAAA